MAGAPAQAATASKLAAADVGVYVQVRPSSVAGAGHGVFATKDFTSGETICTSPYLLIDKQVARSSTLIDYVIEFSEMQSMVPFGYLPIINHSVDPNAQYVLSDDDKDATLIVHALKDIKCGDELFINYGGDWFASRDGDDDEELVEHVRVRVGPSGVEGGGRGVFATGPSAAGDLLEVAPYVSMPASCIDESLLADYAISSAHDDGDVVLPFGYLPFYNHSKEPNAKYYHDDRGRNLMWVYAIRDVATDDELLISYGDNWFPSRSQLDATPTSRITQ